MLIKFYALHLVCVCVCRQNIAGCYFVTCCFVQLCSSRAAYNIIVFSSYSYDDDDI